jgi:Chlamydia polymorphic membrane protein (Chlamydia_PMP) repeat
MKPMRFAVLFTSIVALALIVATFTSPVIAEPGTTFTVNASNDVVDFLPGDGICETATGNGMCTLRAAIMEANSHIGADTIFLPASTYLLTIPGAGEEQCATGDLNITESLTIIGDPNGTPVIDANGLGDRVLQILPAGGPVSISNVYIKNGSTTQHGGGIWSSSTLELHNVYVIGNHANGYGGGIDASAPLTMTDGAIEQNSGDTGGGIFIYADLSMDNILISGNTANRYGAGLYFSVAEAQLDNILFYQNAATDNGGGIYNDRGDMTIIDSNLQQNSSDTSGGGIFNSEGSISLTKVQFVNNDAYNFGGGIDNVNGTIDGQDLLFDQNTTVADGGGGGAITNLTGSVYLNQSVLSNNTGFVGGAINNLSSGFFTLEDSTVISNTASSVGGGFYNAATMSLKGVTVSNNEASDSGGIFNFNSLSVTNSTISGNRATRNGGGIYNQGTAFINSSTIARNLAASTGITGDGGGLYAGPVSTSVFRNTILYGNHHRSDIFLIDDECYGTLSTQRYNLIGTLTGCTLDPNQDYDIVGEDPLLGVLADNGGPTLTIALLDGSPAIDAANPNGCYDHFGTTLTIDQRGFPRNWDGNGGGEARCDIGSYEYGSRLLFFLPLTLR